MGIGFYHVELAPENSVIQAVECNLIDIPDSMAFCTYWTQGFSQQEADKAVRNSFNATTFFPGMPNEYLTFLEEIGGHIGTVQRKGDQQQNTKIDNIGMPSIRLILTSLQQLPTMVKLPTMSVGTMD